MIKLERRVTKPKAPEPTVEAHEMPVYAPEPSPATNSEGEKAQKRYLKPFTAIDESRNYRAFYRTAWDYHERHNPPVIGDDNGEAYWNAAADDLEATGKASGYDPFLTAMLIAVYEELEREYQALQGAERAV